MATKTTSPAVTPDPKEYPGLAPRGYDPAYGGVPGTYNPLATAAEAVRGDIDLLPDLKALGRQTSSQLADRQACRNAAIGL